MILITGAAGKTGRAALRTLAKMGYPVKALVFRAEQIQEVEALGVKEVLAGDMRDSAILTRAMQEVSSVYHICPNLHPDEVSIGQRIIDAAKMAGVAHFVYHSVLHPQIEEMPHHWKKMQVEEYLFASGLAFTILQPGVYLQNILASWKEILETGDYTVPYSVDSRLSMVDLEDVALAAAIVLTEVHSEGKQPVHAGATYELAGTPITHCEVAASLTKHLGRPVAAMSITTDDWKRRQNTSGLGDYQLSTLVKMFDYYDKHGLFGSPHVLNWLLNRPGTSLDTFIERTREASVHYAQ